MAMIVGSAAIVAMSSWLNAAALAGAAAVEQHLSITGEKYQESLEQAHENALAAQGLLPDIRIAASKFSDLALQEQREGALTGSSGSGTVVQLLEQTSRQLSELETQIVDSKEQVSSLYNQGAEHLKQMRSLVSQQEPVSARSVLFAEEAAQVAAIVAELKQTSVAPAVQRAALDFERSFVAPAPDGSSALLRQQQERVVANVQEVIREQSKNLSAAAQSVLSNPQVHAPRYTPISTAEAVLIYAGDFIPSWAGAIAIDLLPAVIAFILFIVHAAVRNHDAPLPVEETMTIRDLQIAMAAVQRISGAQQDIAPFAGEAGRPSLMPDPEPSPDLSQDPKPESPGPNRPDARPDARSKALSRPGRGAPTTGNRQGFESQ